MRWPGCQTGAQKFFSGSPKSKKGHAMKVNHKAIFSIMGFFLLLGTCSTALSGPTGPTAVVGIYDLIPMNDPKYAQRTFELSRPWVAGLSARFTWNYIEPEQGRYNWSVIDNVIARAKKYSKKIMLRVVAGVNTPGWVFANGAQYIPATVDNNLYKVPVFWDPIYLESWCNFIQALANRYEGNANIIGIQMAGAGLAAEMSIYVPDIDWTEHGYSIDTYVSAWKTIIDAYRTSFPSKILHLNIHTVLGNDVTGLTQIMDYCLNTYPNLVFIQANDLRSTGSDYSQYAQQNAAETGTGYQMYGGRNWKDKIMGDRMSAFKLGLADKIIYAEVYQSDIIDSTLTSAMKFLANGLHANADLYQARLEMK
jgi:hypothetical protein